MPRSAAALIPAGRVDGGCARNHPPVSARRARSAGQTEPLKNRSTRKREEPSTARVERACARRARASRPQRCPAGAGKELGERSRAETKNQSRNVFDPRFAHRGALGAHVTMSVRARCHQMFVCAHLLPRASATCWNLYLLANDKAVSPPTVLMLVDAPASSKALTQSRRLLRVAM